MSEVIRSLPLRSSTRTQCLALLSDPVGHGLSPSFIADTRQLVLSGTIPIVYLNQHYNIPISITLHDPSFPDTKPMTVLVPSQDMTIKPAHSCVDAQGIVVKPWNAHKSTLLDYVGELSRVFSAEPPLFKSKKKAVAMQQVQQQQIVGDGENESVEQQVLRILEGKAKGLLKDALEEIAGQVADLEAKQILLDQNCKVLDQELKDAEQLKIDVVKATGDLDVQIEELDKFLKENEKAVEEFEEKNVMDILIPGDTWSQQLLGAVAEDHAIEDLYYELDKMLEDGRIRLDDFIKHVRKAARDQFSARLLVRRIQEKQSIS